MVPFYDSSRADDKLEKDLVDLFEQVLTKTNRNWVGVLKDTTTTLCYKIVSVLKVGGWIVSGWKCAEEIVSSK